MIDLQVTAYLDTPVIGTLSPLDAPLSYAAYQRAVRDGRPLPPMTDEYVTDFPLPLSRWEREGVWGWCTSDAIVSIHDFSTSVEIRRKPATREMARFTKAKDHHSGLGAMKARNTVLSADYYRELDWLVACDDQAQADALLDLLGDVTNLGARHRNGFGHVQKWELRPLKYTDMIWEKRRPMPTPDGPVMRRPRAPYHHPSGRVPHDR